MQISIDRLCDAKGEEDEKVKKKKGMGGEKETFFFLFSVPFLA